jgi:hypothetical protein
VARTADRGGDDDVSVEKCGLVSAVDDLPAPQRLVFPDLQNLHCLHSDHPDQEHHIPKVSCQPVAPPPSRNARLTGRVKRDDMIPDLDVRHPLADALYDPTSCSSETHNEEYAHEGRQISLQPELIVKTGRDGSSELKLIWNRKGKWK